MDQGGDLHTRIGSLVLFQVKTDIIANGLRQTGGSDADGRRSRAIRRLSAPPKMAVVSLKLEEAISMGSLKWLIT
jgi:hypothetical protein